MKRRTLHLHGFIVEFFTDAHADPTTHHYTVTRAGAKDILAWGRCEDQNKCEAEARAAVKGLMNRKAKSHQAASST